jgi:hypothetical protein
VAAPRIREDAVIIIRYVICSLLLFVIFTVAAFRYLEWGQALLICFGMIAAFFFGLKLIIKSFMNNLGRTLLAGFDIKSRVLRGAGVEVHSVHAVPRPPAKFIDQEGNEDEDEDEDEDDDDEEEPAPDADRLAYYRIDFTLRPLDENAGPMQHWDLDDLCVVDVAAPPLSLDPNQSGDPGVGYHLADIQIFEAGKFQDDDQGKHVGTQRVSTVIAVPPELRELKFRYYTEQFGRVTLPPPMITA